MYLVLNRLPSLLHNIAFFGAFFGVVFQFFGLYPCYSRTTSKTAATSSTPGATKSTKPTTVSTSQNPLVKKLDRAKARMEQNPEDQDDSTVDVAGAKPTSPEFETKSIRVDEFKDGKIRLSSSDETIKLPDLKTKLKLDRFLTVLSPSGPNPYLIFVGADCSLDCSTKKIFLIPVFPSKSDAKIFDFTYPGRLRDPKKGIYYEGKAYFGKCLDDDEALVIYQNENVDKRHRNQKSVLVVKAGATSIAERLFESQYPKYSIVESRVKRHLCKTIPPEHRVVHGGIREILRLDEDAPKKTIKKETLQQLVEEVEKDTEE